MKRTIYKGHVKNHNHAISIKVLPVLDMLSALDGWDDEIASSSSS